MGPRRNRVGGAMTDDIVTRLRKIAPIHEGRKGHECIAESADEIERLRAERQKQYTLLLNVVEGKNWNPVQIAEIISKAVRYE